MSPNAGEVFTGALDFNEDSVIFPTNQDIIDAIDNGDDGMFALYYTSLSSLSSCAVDDSNYLYVSYSAFMESLDQGQQNYRHVYTTMSKDGGVNWSYPLDVTPDDEYAECVFASMTPSLNDTIHFVYQRDAEPGLSVRGDEDAPGTNDIVYVKVAASSIKESTLDTTSAISEPLKTVSNLSLYPNPASTYTTLAFTITSKESIKIEVKDVLGKTIEVLSPVNTLSTGTYTSRINTANYKSGVYFVNLVSTNGISTKKLIVR
jgi:hypothetical protein